ncbi:MAG: hypothetical protein ACOX8W_01160 [bacterium]|jgi:hypothetical protein
MAKKKKKGVARSTNYRERKMRRANPYFVLLLYFIVCALLAYPAAWLVFNVFMQQNLDSFYLLRLSVGLGIAGAAYFGVNAKARREGRG